MQREEERLRAAVAPLEVVVAEVLPAEVHRLAVAAVAPLLMPTSMRAREKPISRMRVRPMSI
jgi:hypothetical protein